ELFDYPFGDSTISTCKIELQQDRLKMFWKNSDGQIIGTLTDLQTWISAKGENLVCATNAGIYDKALRPLGLYIENGVVLRKLNSRKNAYGNFYMQPNGVFWV